MSSPLDQLTSVSTVGEKIALIALSQVGTREEGGNNRGASIRRYQAATWLQPGPWPWCAAFVCWVLQRLLTLDGAARAALGLHSGSIDDWRPQTAGAFDFERWARKRGLQMLDEGAAVLAGDIVIFDFSHIGIVVEPAAVRSKFIKTVEGNTNGRGERDSESGDGVWAKTRPRELAKLFIRVK